jgi:hypothetical protein
LITKLDHTAMERCPKEKISYERKEADQIEDMATSSD